ncbi:MAG: glycosyltransferase, partial [Burkholderiales bacterium]|nr:glycosyltransferase [Burkholderiales bacterium]
MKQITSEREGVSIRAGADEAQGAAHDVATQPDAHAAHQARFYIPVIWKFSLALSVGLLWMAFSIVAAQPWIHDLAGAIGSVPAHLTVYGIAVIPGFMNAFLVASLLLDHRPKVQFETGPLPGLSILVAAYNEAANIAATIESIAKQNYPGPLQVIVINDGSTDGTAETLASLDYPWLEVINLAHNG